MVLLPLPRHLLRAQQAPVVGSRQCPRASPAVHVPRKVADLAQVLWLLDDRGGHTCTRITFVPEVEGTHMTWLEDNPARSTQVGSLTALSAVSDCKEKEKHWRGLKSVPRLPGAHTRAGLASPRPPLHSCSTSSFLISISSRARYPPSACPSRQRRSPSPARLRRFADFGKP